MRFPIHHLFQSSLFLGLIAQIVICSCQLCLQASLVRTWMSYFELQFPFSSMQVSDANQRTPLGREGMGCQWLPGAHWRFSSVNICKCRMHATSQIPRKVVFAWFRLLLKAFILAHKTIVGLNTFMVLGYCLRGHLHII